MPVVKQNKLFTRLVVAIGTLAAGLGIWAAVSSQPLNTQTATTTSTAMTSTSTANSDFSSNDNFLATPDNQNAPSVGTYSIPNQTVPRIRTRGS